jgi:hypothetical protein
MFKFFRGIRTGKEKPVDTVDKSHFVEVDEETDGHIKKFHVAEKLCLVDWQDLSNCLGLDQQAVLDEEIEAEGFLFGEVLVGDLDGFLRGMLYAAQGKFLAQAPFVDRFDQPGAFVAMHLDGRANDGLGETGGFLEKRVHGVRIFEQEEREETEAWIAGFEMAFFNSRSYISVTSVPSCSIFLVTAYTRSARCRRVPRGHGILNRRKGRERRLGLFGLRSSLKMKGNLCSLRALLFNSSSYGVYQIGEV